MTYLNMHMFSYTTLECFMFAFQGLKSEGLYRISGFSDSVEEVKTGFDKGLYHLCFIHLCHKNEMCQKLCANIQTRTKGLNRIFFSNYALLKISSMAEGFQELQTASNVKLLEFGEQLTEKITVLLKGRVT